jgi:hypothetical protein
MTDNKWTVALIDKATTFTPADGTHTYLPPVEIEGNSRSLMGHLIYEIPGIQVALGDIEITDPSIGDEFHATVMYKDEPIAKISYGHLPVNACIEQPLPGWREEPLLIPTEISPAGIPVQNWISSLIVFARNFGNEQLSELVESMPDDLRAVGLSRVIVPTSEFITDDMLEATRGLLLYTDTFGTLDSEYVREAISRRPWVGKHIPEWFNEYRGHMTKDARADLAYALTLAAYTNPPAPAEKQFPTSKAPGRSLAPSAYGCKLSITDGVKSLDITREFESWRVKLKHGDLFDIQINRHQLPEYWRKLFKKNAIDISGFVKKDSVDGEISLENARISLGLRNEYASVVTFAFEKCLKIKKGF